MSSATLSLAQDGQVSAPEAPSVTRNLAMEPNSEHCGFTLFTDGADNIDLRGRGDNDCFDLKGGDDVLILNRSSFPKGVRIFTGTGRDTVWAGDGPDLVQDEGAEDKDIRTFAGDDRIIFNLEIDMENRRTGRSAERTDVMPGSGRNMIIAGRNLDGNARPRISPNLWISTDPDAVDRIEATCGKLGIDTDGYDIRSMIIPETASVSYDLDGCDLGVFGLYGNAAFDVVSGRQAIQTYSEGFRVPAGVNLPRLTGQIHGSTGLLLDIDASSPDTMLSWEGSGSAFLRSRITDSGTGGHVQLRSARDIQMQADIVDHAIHYDFAARNIVRLDLVSRGLPGASLISLSAPRMDIAWRLAGQAGFPQIVNDVPVTYLETSFIMPDQKEAHLAKRTETAREEVTSDDAIADQIEAVSSGNPADALVLREPVTITPGVTRLRLELRRDSDRFARCVAVRVTSLKSVLPEKSGQCLSIADPVQRIVIPAAEGYDMILVEGDGVDLEIPINAASRFKVSVLEIQL